MRCIMDSFLKLGQRAKVSWECIIVSFDGTVVQCLLIPLSVMSTNAHISERESLLAALV